MQGPQSGYKTYVFKYFLSHVADEI